MAFKILLTTSVLCAVIVIIKSDRDHHRGMSDYVRVKRAKYYSSPPPRLYKRPPFTYQRGVISYTPPPGYMEVEEVPSNYKPMRVNQRPNSEGLGDEDVNNIIKYLSKQDLDKIIEFAGEKDKNKNTDYVKNKIEYYNELREDNKPYKSGQEDSNPKFSLNGPYVSNNNKGYDIEFSNPYTKEIQPKIVNTNTFMNNIDFFTHVDTEESIQDSQVTVMNAQVSKETNQIPDFNNGILYTDSKSMQEERLPKPVNLREELDFDASFTHNMPTIVKAESSSYKIENFGDLPLMDYNSKLHTVSSYHVPHYTVTTPKRSSSSTSSISSSSYTTASKVPELEPAPPQSAAKDQSDAHLKAVKIWTHRSKGTAYTLHNDGTLSLERPARPKPYGYP